MVSKAKGKTGGFLERVFRFFAFAADSAAETAVEEDADKWKAATALATVTSHVALRPSRRGIRVSPSGFFRQARLGRAALWLRARLPWTALDIQGY